MVILSGSIFGSNIGWMGVPVDYDDEVERKRTHPMLLPKIEPEHE